MNKDNNNHHTKRPKLGTFLFLVFILFITSILIVLYFYFPESISSTDDQMHLLYLLALVTFFSSSLLFVRIINFGEFLRNVSIWFLIASIVVIGYTMQNELKEIPKRIISEIFPNQPFSISEQEIILSTDERGHFNVIGKVNGKRIKFLIDTGATGIVLSSRHARRIGINVDALNYDIPMQTANGITKSASYKIQSLTIGHITLNNLSVYINQSNMEASLLGMTFLNKLKSFRVEGRNMILKK
tara:strand:- start:1092 stop:1820 length:729 start_codon:yes stop_codon:yes gene_type:complete